MKMSPLVFDQTFIEDLHMPGLGLGQGAERKQTQLKSQGHEGAEWGNERPEFSEA